MTPLATGTRVGSYVIQALIGQGGMGDVYRAVRPDIRRAVALKVLSPTLAVQSSFAGRFVREARTMGQLEHPGIVRVYDAGEADGHLYLAMQLIGSGATVKTLLGQGRPAPERALAVLQDVAAALDYAHARGVIHRDVKPANVLLNDDGRAVLADFGIARALDDVSATLSGSYLGTPLYAAPEQAAGRSVGHRADLYSLGCLAFELLTGSPPYWAEDLLTLVLAHGSQPVPKATDRVPDLPPAVNDVLATAMAKPPLDRYPSGAALAEALQDAMSGALRPDAVHADAVHADALPADVVPIEAGRRSGRSVSMLAAVTAVAVTAIVGVAGFLLTGRGSDGQSLIAPSTATAASSSTAASASSTPQAPPLGERFLSARFDDAGTGFTDRVGRPTDPAAQKVTFADGALTLRAGLQSGNAGTDLDVTINAPYVVTMTYAVEPGSQVMFDLGLRWAVPGKLAYLLRTNTTKGTVALLLFKDGQLSPLAPPTPVDGLGSGRDVTLTVAVGEKHLTLWVNGTRAADVADGQVPETAGTIPGLDVYGNPGKGAVTVKELSYYSYAGDQRTPTAGEASSTA